MLPVRPDEPYDSNQQNQPNGEIELVEVLAQVAPVLSQFHARVAEAEAPGP